MGSVDRVARGGGGGKGVKPMEGAAYTGAGAGGGAAAYTGAGSAFVGAM